MPIVFNNSNAANVQTPSVDKTTLFIANTQLATKDANGNVTYYNAGGNGSPGGVTTSVQFNNSGAFAGNSAFTYDEANSLLSVGNISISGTAQVGNLSIANITLTDISVIGNANIGNLKASNSNLGSNSNVIITGGTAGYVLSTNGSGNLSWVAQTGGGGGNTDWANIGNITNAYGPTSIIIGQNAGNSNSLANYNIAIGSDSGLGEHGTYNISIGSNSGGGGGPGAEGGSESIAIGHYAAESYQGNRSIALGSRAATASQGDYGIAIGYYAGAIRQLNQSISIGQYAGYYHQGNIAISIGALAGFTAQHDNTIILNATSPSQLNSTQANSFYVAPIRNDTSNTANSLYYNTATKEVTYGPGGGGPGRIAAIYVYTRSSGTVQVPVTGGYLNVVGRSAIIPIPVN